MRKHTPGPWSATHNMDGASWTIRLDDRTPVASVSGAALHNLCADNDARLIAAAPDLLAALELCADTIRSYDGGDLASDDGWKNEQLRDCWLRARAAMAKATGGE